MCKRAIDFRKYKIVVVFLFLAIRPVLAQVPTVASFAPQHGPLGTRVTITGNNFGATAAQNTVYFGPVRAVITSASATSITALVPLGASFDPISVTVAGLTAYAAAPF